MLVSGLVQGSACQPLIERTIGDAFDEMVERWPQREAVVSRHEGKRCSYRELQRARRGASKAEPSDIGSLRAIKWSP
jgi:fatty-acyl-CoA synthase